MHSTLIIFKQPLIENKLFTLQFLAYTKLKISPYKLMCVAEAVSKDYLQNLEVGSQQLSFV